MNKRQHISHHKKLHTALLVLVTDWQACSPDGGYRITEKRSVRSLLEWSERQTTTPEKTTTQTPRMVPTRKPFIIKSSVL